MASRQERFRLDTRKTFFTVRRQGGEALEQVARGDCGIAIPGGVQKVSDLALGDVVYWFRDYSCSAGPTVGPDDLKGSFQP